MNIIQQTTEALLHVNEAQLAHTLTVLNRVASDPKARVFSIGNGGGYSHASHFAADLRKIAHISALSFDSIGEMTARINDDTWELAWSDWMESNSFGHHDVLFVFSVGGGGEVSKNLCGAIDYAMGSWTETLDAAEILGIVGSKGGYLQMSGHPIIIPSTSTPVIEGAQAVIAHYLVDALQ